MKCRIVVFCALLAASAAMARAQVQGTIANNAPAQAQGAFTITCGPNLVTQEITTATKVGTFNCTTNANVNGVALKGMTWSAYGQYGPSANNVWGVIVGTLASGDQVYFTYYTVDTVKNGVIVSGSTTYKIVGGTGAVNGISGSGTCGVPVGPVRDCMGTYATR